MNNIKGLPPFKRFCVTIGNLPSSYVDSMSYYECLMWLCKYLKDTVIPVVNENAEAVNELINWFNNLDVQDEINNKLDEMVESGQLQEIISEYLNSTAVFGFNTVADMQSATNLINGSYARTCGYNSFNDGKGELYKIRNVVSGDVVDNYNIIEISSSLVAERIVKGKGKILLIGDSYLDGANLTNPATENWGYVLMQKMGYSSSDYYKLSEGGAGFTIQGNQGHTFLTLLQSQIANLDVNRIEKIIVGGGYNDITNQQSTIESAISSFISYCKTNIPNATVYLANIAGNSKVGNAPGQYRQWLRERSIPAYSNASLYGGIYINGCDKVLHDYTYNNTGENQVHPNANGHQAIASYLYNAIVLGSYDYYKKQAATNGTLPAGVTGSITFTTGIENNEAFLNLYAAVTFTTPIAAGYLNNVDLGAQDLQYLRYVATSTTQNSKPIPINVLYSDNTHETLLGTARINDANHIILNLGYATKAVSKIELSFGKFYWDYRMV